MHPVLLTPFAMPGQHSSAPVPWRPIITTITASATRSHPAMRSDPRSPRPWQTRQVAGDSGVVEWVGV